MRAFAGLLFVATLCAQSDPENLLARVREKLQDTIGRMPRYTCTENISRTQFEPRAALKTQDCDAATRLTAENLIMTTSDRLRLDVAMAGKIEIYSWAGENRFDDRGLIDIVGSGPISTGAFGSFVIMVFGTKAADISFVREMNERGRRLLEYEYNVPLARSQYMFSSKGSRSLVAYHGTFLLDPAAVDLVRLVVRVDQPPSNTHACFATSTFEYGRVRLHDTDFLLPNDATLRIVNENGVVGENRTVYSACHEFRGESSIKFSEEEPGSIGQSGRSATTAGVKLPDQIMFEVRIAQDIDTEKAAAGDQIRAELMTPIIDEAGTILVGAPTAVVGRILRLQHFFGPKPYVNLKWKLESIEAGGKLQPLTARPLGLAENDALVMNLNNAGARHVLKSGTTSKWVTGTP